MVNETDVNLAVTNLGEFFQGEYGFLTIIAIIVAAIWIGSILRKKWIANKTKKQLQDAGLADIPPPPKPLAVKKPVMSKPIPGPAPSKDDEFFELELDPDKKSLGAVEQDAISILKKKTEDIEVSLIKEKQIVEKKLAELDETERGIREIVQQLKAKYQQVKQQQRTYELMKKSLTYGNRGQQNG
jgi:hypothetical protein